MRQQSLARKMEVCAFCARHVPEGGRQGLARWSAASMYGMLLSGCSAIHLPSERAAASQPAAHRTTATTTCRFSRGPSHGVSGVAPTPGGARAPLYLYPRHLYSSDSPKSGAYIYVHLFSADSATIIDFVETVSQPK